MWLHSDKWPHDKGFVLKKQPIVYELSCIPIVPLIVVSLNSNLHQEAQISLLMCHSISINAMDL